MKPTKKLKPCLRCGHSAEKHHVLMFARSYPACSVQYCACPCYRGVQPLPKRKPKW